MFDFKNEFPHHYRDVFARPSLLKTYLNEAGFVHAVEKMMYNSQLSYFRAEPDCVAEFLLEYRQTMLHALANFVHKGISLEQYIGHLLKLYRRNFAKLKQAQSEKYEMLHSSYSEITLNRDTGQEHLENLREPDCNYCGPSAAWDEQLTLLQAPQSGDGREIRELILHIAREIAGDDRENLGNKIQFSRLLQVLLVLNTEHVGPPFIDTLLRKAGFSALQYENMLTKRETYLAAYRQKRNEQQRLLHRCYLKYLATQRRLHHSGDEHEAAIAEREDCKNDLQRQYRALNALRMRYSRMRRAISIQQLAELLQIPAFELRPYFVKIQEYMMLKMLNK